MSRRLLTLADAARDLDRSREFVRHLIADGLLDGRKLRGRWYVTERSLDHYVESGSPLPLPKAEIAPMPEVVRPFRSRRDAA